MESDPNASEWEYVGTAWPSSAADATGWDHPSVATVMLEALPAFIRVVTSAAPLSILPLATFGGNENGHNISMTFGYVLARAAHGKIELSLLDWGGALGQYAIMAQRLLPEVALSVTVKERPELARLGQGLLPWVNFETTDDACFTREYDLAMASNSLQYAEDWRALFANLARSARQFLFVTRLPVTRTVPSFVVVHRPYAYYQAEYLSWVINYNELLRYAASVGLTLEREFMAGSATAYTGTPETSESSGFLFKK